MPTVYLTRIWFGFEVSQVRHRCVNWRTYDAPELDQIRRLYEDDIAETLCLILKKILKVNGELLTIASKLSLQTCIPQQWRRYAGQAMRVGYLCYAWQRPSPTILTATILEREHLLKPDKHKDIIIKSLCFLTKKPAWKWMRSFHSFMGKIIRFRMPPL